MAESGVEATSKAGTRLLSLDGGGIRGLSQLFIIREMMGKIRHDLGLQADPPPWEYFDLIAGSGTGGLIAILFGRLNLNVDRSIEVYIALCEHAFEKTSLLGLWRSPENEVKSTIQHLVGVDLDLPMVTEKTTQSKHHCETFVCSLFEENMDHPRIIRTYDVRSSQGPRCSIWEAIRATVGYPFFSEPTVIGTGIEEERLVSTSRFRWNNPLRLLKFECRSLYPDTQHIACVLSVGSGRPPPISFSYDFRAAYNLPLRLFSVSSGTSLIQTLQSISTDCESTVEDFKESITQEYTNFIRLSVDNGMQSVGLTDWRKKSEVKAHTASYVARVEIQELIDKAVNSITRPSELSSFQTGVWEDESSTKPPQESIATIRPSDLVSCNSEAYIALGSKSSVYVAVYRKERVVVKQFYGPHSKKNLASELALYQQMHPAPCFPSILGSSPMTSTSTPGSTYLVFRGSDSGHVLPNEECEMPGSVEQYLAWALTRNSSTYGTLAGAKMFLSLSQALPVLNSLRVPIFLGDKPNVSMWVDEGCNFRISLVHTTSAASPGFVNDERNHQDLAQAFYDLSQKAIATANTILYEDYRYREGKAWLQSADENEEEHFDGSERHDNTSSSTVPNAQRATPSQGKPRREFAYDIRDLHSLDFEQVALENRNLLHRARLRPGLPILRSMTVRDPSGVQHRCPGYSREEITLSPYSGRSAVVVYRTPYDQERCQVCHKLVTAGYFKCTCGVPDNGTEPTIVCNRKSGCKLWGHQRCETLFQEQHICSSEGYSRSDHEGRGGDYNYRHPTMLHDLAAASGYTLVYSTPVNSGSAHQPTWTVRAYINAVEYGTGTSTSIRQATIQAAGMALNALRGDVYE